MQILPFLDLSTLLSKLDVECSLLGRQFCSPIDIGLVYFSCHMFFPLLLKICSPLPLRLCYLLNFVCHLCFQSFFKSLLDLEFNVARHSSQHRVVSKLKFIGFEFKTRVKNLLDES